MACLECNWHERDVAIHFRLHYIKGRWYVLLSQSKLATAGHSAAVALFYIDPCTYVSLLTY